MSKASSISVFDVADFFIHCIDVASGSVMTPLRLQKLVYYAQAWSLVLLGEELFPEDFYAWARGPICEPLWEKYKDVTVIYSTDNYPTDKFTEEQIELLDEVWDTYGIYDAAYLERLVHSEWPWQQARQDYTPEGKCCEVISKAIMKRYYQEQYDGIAALVSTEPDQEG